MSFRYIWRLVLFDFKEFNETALSENVGKENSAAQSPIAADAGGVVYHFSVFNQYDGGCYGDLPFFCQKAV